MTWLSKIILAVALTVSTLGVSQAAIAQDFVARDATRYPQNPNLAPYGLKNILVAYEGSLWPSGSSDTARPNLNYIRDVYIPKIKSSKPDVLVLDIERYRWNSDVSATKWNQQINDLKAVVALFKRQMPNTKIGYYLIMPQRNWLAACGDPRKVTSRTRTWHNFNLRMQPLADVVDIIFPSLYAFYGDTKSVSCYGKYVAANVKEARIYGKPVWAFVWMKYQSNGTWIPGTVWRQMLESIYNHADGVVIWSKAKGSTNWSWTAPWWLQTKDFLKDHNLVP